MSARPTEHGTSLQYGRGCRCDDCRSAWCDDLAERRGHHRVTKCAVSAGTSSRCQRIASHLEFTAAAVARVARLANRSPKMFAAYADELASAKADRAVALSNRDEHMAECPAAAERFGSSLGGAA